MPHRARLVSFREIENRAPAGAPHGIDRRGGLLEVRSLRGADDAKHAAVLAENRAREVHGEGCGPLLCVCVCVRVYIYIYVCVCVCVC